MNNKEQTIKAVIFDMDGLMFDTEELFDKVEHKMADKRGRAFTLDIKNKIMGMKLMDAILVMKRELDLKDSPEDLFNEFDLLYQDVLKSDLQERPGLFSLLETLEENLIDKAIATSSMRHWTKLTLDKFDLSRRFNFILTGDDVENGKPHPEIYKKATAAFRLDAKECLVLEDAGHGVKAAHDAGCYVVAVPNEYTKDHDFADADLVVDSLDDPRLLSVIFA